VQKRAGIKRGKLRKRNPYRPASKVVDFGFSRILKRIDRSIEVIGSRK
jgi:hypothetical protein